MEWREKATFLAIFLECGSDRYCWRFKDYSYNFQPNDLKFSDCVKKVYIYKMTEPFFDN